MRYSYNLSAKNPNGAQFVNIITEQTELTPLKNCEFRKNINLCSRLTGHHGVRHCPHAHLHHRGSLTGRSAQLEQAYLLVSTVSPHGDSVFGKLTCLAREGTMTLAAMIDKYLAPLS
jgi:hypothetical protein